MIEDSLTISPRDERALFCNRDKLDLIAIYDDTSETPGLSDAPLSKLEHVIYKTAFCKILKRVLVLHIGGLKAWKREFSQQQLIVAEVPFSVFVPPSPQPQFATVAASPTPLVGCFRDESLYWACGPLF